MSRLLILYCLFAIHCSIAQTIENFNKLQGDFLGQELGLLQLNVKGMALDNLGYLWAGTEDGLHKFNGYEFKAYLHDPNDNATLKDDHVRSLLFTNDTLWIATNSKGVLGFILSKNSFFDPLPTGRNLDLNTSYKVLKLGKDFILFSVKNNLIVFNRHTKKTKVISLPKKAKENYVTDILHIDKEKYWLATTASGILELNSNTFELNETTLLQKSIVLSFYKQDKTIYIGIKDGLYIYNLLTSQYFKTGFTFSVNCFYKLNNTQFYLGTKNGLFLFDSTSNNITTYLLENKENKSYQVIDINQIIGDSNGNLWIGTEGDGLFYYNNFQKKFNTLKLELEEYPLINRISTFQILKGKDSTLWLGTKYGLVKYNHTTHNFKLYKTKEPILIYTIPVVHY